MTTHTQTTSGPVALVTGASQGLGHALARALAERGWRLVVDGRDPAVLEQAAAELGTTATSIAGSVADETHRRALVEATAHLGRLDLLVNNASTLGASPLPGLDAITDATLREVFEVNLVAPIALTRALLPLLTASHGTVLNISSDAAVEAYEGWGGYGASKAALDQATAVLAAEHPELSVHAFDPGDMRTALHQAAYPGEDISDRPEPSTVVPALLRVIDERPAGVRLRASDLPTTGRVAS